MKKAFTLVELLIVIAILAVLATVVFVVINPGQRINEATDTKLRQETEAMQKAFELYAIDNGGEYPTLSSAHDYDPIPSHDEVPSTTDCQVDTDGGAFLTRYSGNLAPSIFPDYLPESPISQYSPGTSAGTNRSFRFYIHEPTRQIIVCTYLSDGTTYYYPQISAD